MNTELTVAEAIKIMSQNINGTLVNAVNSRDIYEYLEVVTPYSMWIQRAIEKYGFDEGVDFTTHKYVSGKATSVDYITTMDMSKELCMVSATPKGKSVRKYFIELEKPKELSIPELLAISTKALTESHARELVTQKMLSAVTIIQSAVTDTENTLSIDEFVKLTNDKLGGLNIGRTALYAVLRKMKLVETTSTKPTQYGTSVYLTWKKHNHVYATRIYVDKADQLIKRIVKHVTEHQELNKALGVI